MSLYGLSRLLIMGGQFLLIPIAISQLGVAGFGIYSILLQGALLIRLVTIQPIAQVYIREYSQLSKSYSDKELYNAALRYVMPVFLLILPLIFVFRNRLVEAMSVSSEQLLLMCGMGVVLSIFGIKQILLYCVDIKKYSFFDMTQSIGVIVGIVIAGMVFPSVESYESAYLIVTLLIVLKLSKEQRTRFQISNRRIEGVGALVLSYGTPLMIGEVFNWVIGVADRFQIVALISPEQAGSYTAAYQLFSAPMTMLGFVIAMVIQPTAFVSDKDVFKTKMEKASTLLVIASAFILVFSYLYGVEIYRVFVSNQATVDATLVTLLVCTGIANSFYQLELVTVKYNRGGISILSAQIVAAIIVLIGNWILLPRIGVNGAAITSVGAYAVMIVLLRYIQRYGLRHSCFSLRSVCDMLFRGGRS